MDSITKEIDNLLGGQMIDVDFSYLQRADNVYQSLPPDPPRGRGNVPRPRYEPAPKLPHSDDSHLFKNFSSVVNDDSANAPDQAAWYATPPPDVKRFSIDINAVATLPRKLRISEADQHQSNGIGESQFRRTTVQSLADLLARTTKHEHRPSKPQNQSAQHQSSQHQPDQSHSRMAMNRKSVGHFPASAFKQVDPNARSHFYDRQQSGSVYPGRDTEPGYQSCHHSGHHSGHQSRDPRWRNTFNPQAHGFDGHREPSFEFDTNPGYRRISHKERYDFLERMNKEKSQYASGDGYESGQRSERSEHRPHQSHPDRPSYNQAFTDPAGRYHDSANRRYSRVPDNWEPEPDDRQSKHAMGVERMKRYSHQVPEPHHRNFSGQSDIQRASRHEHDPWGTSAHEKRRLSFFDMPVEPLRISRPTRPLSVYERYRDETPETDSSSGAYTPAYEDQGYRTSRFSSSSARDYNTPKRQSYAGFTAKRISRSERVVTPSNSFDFTPDRSTNEHHHRQQVPRQDHRRQYRRDSARPPARPSRQAPLEPIQNNSWDDYKREDSREYYPETPRRWRSRLRVRRHCYGYVADQLAAIPEPEEDDSNFSLLHTPQILLKKEPVPPKPAPRLPVLVEKHSTGTSPFSGVRVTRRTMAPVPKRK